MRRFEAERGGGGGGRHARKTVLLEALEPRMLLSADVSPFGGSGLHDDDALSMLVRDADDATSLTPEIVFLSTGGAQDVDYLGPVTIEDIDVAAFAAPGLLGGQESEILDALLASMEAAADDGLRFVFERPDAGDYATVHLGSVGGAFDAYGEYWGVAEHVDAGNVDRSDMAFVFSDVIDAALGLGEYVARLADVVLHEVGHLRGQAHDEHAHGAAEGPLADVAFDPKVHVAIGNQAADDAADGFVTIDGETYAVHPLIKDAMHADYRAFFNAGAVAGDGFPDVLMGQFAIHPVDHATWLTRVLDMAWKAQTDSAWDATERKQILAWSYGFLSHSAADHWAHTLVNSFAEGVAPGFGAAAVSIPTDQRDLGNMLRHFMTEAYIADSLPGFDANKSERTLVGPGDYSDDSTPAIAYDAPIRFIYEALLRAFPDDPTPMVEMAWEKGTLTANAGANTFVRSEGSFADDGFKVGHKITVANFGANDGEYFVTAVTDSGKTLTVNGPLAGGAATGDEKIFARVAKTASIAITADAETNTFTRTSGSFKTDGFVAGMRFDVLGFTSNARTYVVKTVTDTVITVEGALSTGSTNFSELVDESGTAQIVAYGQRGPALDNFFKLRDAVFKAAAAKGARGDVAELETIAADVITKLVNGTTIDQTTKDNLARAYLYNWADEIDEGVRHWGEFGLAFTKAMFDAGSRRDLQEKVGDATGFADSADSSTIRSKAEDGVGILDVLIEELDDPNGDGSTLDSFINLHLMPMAGLPAELGLLRSGLQALGEQLDTILQPIKEVFNPLKSAINDAKTYVKDLVKAQIEKKFGFSFEVFDFLKQLGNKMDLASVTLPGGAVVPIFKPGDHERLDAILGLPADHHEGTAPVGINKLDRFFQFYAGAEDRLDDNAVMGTVSPFAAFENAVTLSKMLLLMEQDPLGVGTAGDDQLSELYSDILTELQGGGPPVTYDFGLMNLNGAHGGNVLTATLPGVSGVDAQQIWMTSIDADQVWRHDNYTVDNALFRIGEFPGTSASHVVYTATNLAAGTYRIYASWQANVTQDLDNLLNSAHPDQKISPTDNAEYTVLVNGGGAKTTHLNQQLFANDLDDGGLGFEQLTFTGGNTFTVGAAGTIQIKLNILTGTGDEHVIAGPIMLVRDDGDADPDNDPRLRIENRRDPVTLAPVATLNQTYVEEDPSLWSDVKYEGGGGNNPLWESEVLRPVFRHLFADWANGALDFPDLGDAASDDPNTTAGIVGTPLGSHATPFGPEIPDNEIQIPIPQALEDAILGGLQGVVNFAKAIENAPPLSAEVPGIGKTLAQLIGLSSAVDRNVRMPVVNYFANDATPTFAEFARVVSPALGPWGPGNSNGSAFEIGIDLSRAFVAEDLRLDLGAALDSFGIEVDAALDVATSFAFVDKATLKLPRFSVGVDLSGALSASDRFYVRAESLHVHAEAHADDIDAQARVAFLSGGVENGTIDLVVDVRIDLDDGSNNDGRLTLGEIASTALSALATVTATGTLAGELPLVISGLTGLTGGSIGSILFGATDVFDTNTFFFDTTGLNADAFNFKNIDAAAIVTLIGQLADQLQDLKQSGALNAIEIPFVDGAVGAVLDFAELVSDGLLYDDGADNTKDGANKLLTDINEALASAGLGDVLIAQGDGTHIDFELLDRTADGFKIQVDAGDAGGFALLAFAPGAAVFETTHRATPGSAVLGSTAKMKVTVKRGSQETATSVTLTADSTDDNTGIGDDTAKLLRADNSATFRTAQDLVFRLATMLGVSNVVEYHGATDALLLKIGALLPRLEISDSFDLSFDVDLGVGDVTTDARVKLTADAGIDPDFVLGIYLGSNVPGAQQGMTGTTPLGSLNGNDGVQIQSAPALTASQPVASQLKPMDGDATFVIQVGEPILGVAIGPDNITLNDPTRNFIGRVFVGDKILNLAEGQLVDVMVVNANSIVTSGLTGPGANWTGDAYQVISKPHTVTVPKTATDGTMAQLVSAINTEIAKNTFLKDKIVAVADGNRLNFTAADPDVVKAFVVTSTAGDPANKVLGIPTSDLSEGALVGDALDTFELLGGDAEFRLTIAGVAYDVVVKQSATQGNATMLALLGDVVDALAAARRVSNGAIESVLSKVTVEASGTSLVLRIKDPAVSAVQFSAALDDPAVLELGLTNEFTLTKPTVKATKAVATVVGRLSSDVTLTITTTGGPSGSVTLDADDTATNTTVLSLVNDLNTALAGSVFAGKLQFDSSGNKLVLMAIDPAITGFTIAVSGASASVLGLPTVATPAENFDFDIRTSNGSLIRVEIPSNAADINAVLNAINNAPGNAGKVEAKINAGATGLLLIDKTFQPLVKDPDGRIVTNPNTHVFTVTPVNGSQAAGDLRIVGVDAASAANLDGRIDGGQLVGVKLTDRFFMRDLAFEASLTVETPVDAVAKANFGFVAVVLTGDADLQASLRIELQDPGTGAAANNEVSLTEFIDGLSSPGSLIEAELGGLGRLDLDVTLDGSLPFITLGSANITLDLNLGDAFGAYPDTATLTGLAREGNTRLSVTGDARNLVTVGSLVTGPDSFKTFVSAVDYDDVDGKTYIDVVSGVNLPGSVAGLVIGTPTAPQFSLRTSGLGDLVSFQDVDFDFAAIIDALILVADLLSNIDGVDNALNARIPLVDVSVNDLLAFADRFSDALADAQRNPAGALQLLDRRLSEAFGVDPDDSTFAFGLDKGGTGTADDVLKFELNLGAAFSRTLGVAIPDLELGLDFIDGAVDFGGSATLGASGAATLKLHLGIEIDEPQKVYLYDTSGLEGSLKLFGEDMAFRAALGPFSLSVIGGEASIEGLISADFDDLFPTGTSRVQITNPLTVMQALDAEVAAPVHARLPIYFPTESHLVGDITLWGDLLNLANDSPLYLQTKLDTLKAEGTVTSATATTLVDSTADFAADGVQANQSQYVRIVAGTGAGQVRAITGVNTSTDTLTVHDAWALTPDATSQYEIFALVTGNGSAANANASAADDQIVLDVSEVLDELANGFGSLSLIDQMLFIVEGVDLVLGGVQDALDGDIMGFSMPLIGDKLAGGANAIGSFRDGFLNDFRTEVERLGTPDQNAVKDVLFKLLGSSGFLLKRDDATGDAVRVNGDFVAGTLDDIETFSNLGTPGLGIDQAEIYWKFTIGDKLLNAGADIGLDLGIPGLGLETDGKIVLDIDWELEVGFGLSGKDGFFFFIDDHDELELNARVTLPDGSLKGTLGFLEFTAEDADVDSDLDLDGDGEFDGDEGSTQLTASFGIDIVNTGDENDERLGLSELGRLGFDVTFEAAAKAELEMTLGLAGDDGGFPEIKADFVLDWGIGPVSLLDPDDDFELGSILQDGLKTVAFANVQLDIGAYISDVIGPLLRKIQEVTEPVQPIIDIVTTPLPVLADLGLEITLLDIAKQTGAVNPALIEAIEVVLEVVSIVNDTDFDADGSLLVPFGDFVVYDSDSPLFSGPGYSFGSLTSGDFDVGGFVNDVLEPNGAVGEPVSSLSSGPQEGLIEVGGAASGVVSGGGRSRTPCWTRTGRSAS